MKLVLTRIIPQAIVRYHQSRQKRAVALTFDDGPDAQNTPQILDTLSRAGQQATFFVEGKKAEKHPEVLRAIREHGCEIANHSYSHARFSTLTIAQVAEEIDQTDRIIHEYQNGPAPFLRPPFGEFSSQLLWYMIRRRRGITLWSHTLGSLGGTDNPMNKSPHEILHDLDRTPPQPGDIILLHDWCPGTTTVLPEVLTRLHQRSLQSVTLSELCT